ncbi:hypothetical protein KEJ40_05530 [Candidatus Bathyarchaeota archaeon]|nr:hypothetical protein [Candidatus Bathyarchaeota archaeon]
MSGMELFSIYILNLIVTIGMFIVLIFRAWIELKHYRIMWDELEWRRTRQVVGRILKVEKELFSKVEGGDELYRLLCKIFDIDEE